jgi:putative addiction module component (TIGR02574 family)
LVIIGEMSTHFHEVEKQARALAPKEKAALARQLIEELDMAADADAEQLWIDEAQRRYDAYLKGELEALPGDEVMTRARNRLK